MGYLKIEIKGNYSENALNLCAANRISLWNSEIIKNGIVTCILIKDFWKFKNIMRGSGLRVHIIEKKGLPINLYKNRNRKGLFIGFIALLIFLKIMSGFIWIIDIEGNGVTATEDIINACKEIGITEGVRGNKINTRLKREELLLKLDTLAWAAFNIEGSRLTVNVTEIKKGENYQTAPANLKAKTDGIIKHIDVSSGFCMVKIGDIVAKGDVLVSGVIEASDGTRFVHSSGSVIAQTKHSIELEREFEYIKKYKTGVTKKRVVLEFPGLKIPLFIGNETKKYDAELNTEQLSLFEKSLPIKIHTKKYYYNTEEKIMLSRKSLEEMLKEDLQKEIKERDFDEHKILSEQFIECEKGLKLIAIIEACEEIGIAEKLLIDAKN